MANFVDKILQRSQLAIGRIVSKSGLNSMLWLCALVSIPCFVLACFGDRFGTCLIVIGVIPIGITCIGFVYFMFKNPDYLRSEKFQLKKQTLELLGEKGYEFEATAEHLVDIVKPQEYLPAPSDEKREETNE